MKTVRLRTEIGARKSYSIIMASKIAVKTLAPCRLFVAFGGSLTGKTTKYRGGNSKDPAAVGRGVLGNLNCLVAIVWRAAAVAAAGRWESGRGRRRREERRQGRRRAAARRSDRPACAAGPCRRRVARSAYRACVPAHRAGARNRVAPYRVQ